MQPLSCYWVLAKHSWSPTAFWYLPQNKVLLTQTGVFSTTLLSKALFLYHALTLWIAYKCPRENDLHLPSILFCGGWASFLCTWWQALALQFWLHFQFLLLSLKQKGMRSSFRYAQSLLSSRAFGEVNGWVSWLLNPGQWETPQACRQKEVNLAGWLLEHTFQFTIWAWSAAPLFRKHCPEGCFIIAPRQYIHRQRIFFSP